MPVVDLVLTESFPLLSMTLVTEPLRVANRELGRNVWSWRLLSVDGGTVRSSSGFEFGTEKLDDEPSKIVLLLSSYRPETALGWSADSSH